MLTRYLELNLYNESKIIPVNTKNDVYVSGHKILMKLDSIRELVDTNSGCIVNGIHVHESYDDIKRLINQDERRVTYGDEMDFRMRYLIRNGMWQIFKDFGDMDGLRFITEICGAAGLDDIDKINEYYTKERKNENISNKS